MLILNIFFILKLFESLKVILNDIFSRFYSILKFLVNQDIDRSGFS